MVKFIDILENFEQLDFKRTDFFDEVQKNVFSIDYFPYYLFFNELTKEIGFLKQSNHPYYIIYHWSYAKKAHEYNIYDIKQNKFLFKHWYNNLKPYRCYKNIYRVENQMQQINFITLKGELLSDTWFDGKFDNDRQDYYLYSKNGFKGYAYILLTKTLNKNEIY